MNGKKPYRETKSGDNYMKECEGCGDLAEESALKKDFLDEMSCSNCRRQHQYIALLDQGKVPPEIKSQIDSIGKNQIALFMKTGKFDHSMTSHWFDKLGISK